MVLYGGCHVYWWGYLPCSAHPQTGCPMCRNHLHFAISIRTVWPLALFQANLRRRSILCVIQCMIGLLWVNLSPMIYYWRTISLKTWAYSAYRLGLINVNILVKSTNTSCCWKDRSFCNLTQRSNERREFYFFNFQSTSKLPVHSYFAYVTYRWYSPVFCVFFSMDNTRT